MIYKFYHIKLKAGALQYTIFISVIIALLIFAFISLTYVQQRLTIKNKQFQEIIESTNQAFYNMTLQDMSYNKETILTAVSEEKNKLRVIKKRWGVFDIASVTGRRNKEIFIKTALLASHQQKRTALYLQDENQPLVLVGNTKIEGTVYLPQQGVKRGTIAGNSYINNQLIFGSIATSNNNLPAVLNLRALKNIEGEFLSNELNEFETLEQGMISMNSFSNPTKIVASNGNIELRDVRLTGNIMIHATHKIKVYASASLTDVILIAPKIEIGERVQGNFQAIATEQIKVSDGCHLTYPTSLMLLEKQQNTTNGIEKEHQIFVGKGSVVKGIVVYISGGTKANYNTQIKIEEEATIEGEVYCNQNIELEGTVNGSVYTKGFIANQFGSVYKNHIYNGKISSSNLPRQYAGLRFKDSHQKTAKWVYY